MAGNDLVGGVVLLGGLGAVAVGAYLVLTQGGKTPLMLPDLSMYLGGGNMMTMTMGDGQNLNQFTDQERKDMGLPSSGHVMMMDGSGMMDMGTMMMMGGGVGGGPPVLPDKMGKCPPGYKLFADRRRGWAIGPSNVAYSCLPIKGPRMLGGISPSTLARVPVPGQQTTPGGFFGFPAPHRTGSSNRIALVRPSFTGAAYNNAFYSWYGWTGCLFEELLKKKAITIPPNACKYPNTGNRQSASCATTQFKAPQYDHFTIGKIPAQTDNHPSSSCMGSRIGHFSAYRVLDWVPHLKQLASTTPNSSFQVIGDETVDMAVNGAALRSMFDVLILGHQEYITQHEYDNLRDFTAAGGTLVLLCGNVFCAKVTYNPSNGNVQFIAGHGNAFDPATSTVTKGFRFDYWYDETKEWAGCAFMTGSNAFFPDPTSPSGIGWAGAGYRYIFNPLGISNGEDNVAVNPNIRPILDLKATYFAPPGTFTSGPNAFNPVFPKPYIGTYQLPSGSGQVIALGPYCSRAGPDPDPYTSLFLHNPKFISFLDALLRNTAFVGVSPMLKAYQLPA